MFQFIEFLKKRPSDKNIRIWRIIFGLIIVFLLTIYFWEYSINLPDSLKQNEFYIKYILLILGIFPIIMWIFDPCIAKRKYIKIAQIFFWIILIIVGKNISVDSINKIPSPVVSNSWSINLADINNTEAPSNPINIGFWIALLSILPIIAWVSGKCISQKCFKHWEVITKIRV